MARNCIDSLIDLAGGFSGKILVEKPCKITKIYSQYLVDVEYYDNNVADTLYKVPVKHMQSKNAYIFLGLRIGDYGTVRFFDNDISNYWKSSSTGSDEQRKHDINDNLFTPGFYPQESQYLFPDGDVVVGTTGGAAISLSGADITISGGNITISGGTINIGGNSSIDGKVFLEHTHSNGNNGSPTGGVL